MNQRAKKIISIITTSVMFLLFCGGITGIWRAIDIHIQYQIPPCTDAQLYKLDRTNISHLMIVAHPDDETLWGGAHLQSGGYLVVCLTNGNHAERAKEFQTVLQASGNIGLILSYPDKVGGKRDNWNHVKKQIKNDLEKILTFKNWDDIVTHNAQGEYGHIHHQMVYQLVTTAYDTTNMKVPLYVFGTYYSPYALPHYLSQLTAISDGQLQCKEMLLQYYRSQVTTISKFSHMNPYENWETVRGGKE